MFCYVATDTKVICIKENIILHNYNNHWRRSLDIIPFSHFFVLLAIPFILQQKAKKKKTDDKKTLKLNATQMIWFMTVIRTQVTQDANTSIP